MNLSSIPVPEVYKESFDFRFFLKWFELCLSKTQYDTDNLVDLLDPERCPSSLLWMLCDTYGFRYDNRMPVAYNRLVLLYFMSMIYNRGSKTGMTIAAQLNLAQFNIKAYAEENPACEDRLEDTSIPVNSAYITGHPDKGYIDVVYYSENIPTDVCTDYVRPLGMYCFTHAGIRVDARTKISVDARLTDLNNISVGIGPTRVGHYRRADYASLQRMVNAEGAPDIEPRNPTYYRNSVYEQRPTKLINPGYRSLYSLQISNNEHIVKSLLPSPIFSLGYGPQDVTVRYPDGYYNETEEPIWNLRYDREEEESLGSGVSTVDPDRTVDILTPRPAVGPIMTVMGDAIPMTSDNRKYTKVDPDTGEIVIITV